MAWGLGGWCRLWVWGFRSLHPHEVPSRVKTQTAPIVEPAFWVNSESRAWEYARFLISTLGFYTVFPCAGT